MNVEFRNNIAASRGNFAEEFPSDFSTREIKLIKEAKGKTMTSFERMRALIQAVDYIEEAKIKGDIVECGVWKGGSMLIAASVLVEKRSFDRRLFLFDTFEGMSDPTSDDVSAVNQKDAESLLKMADKEDGDNIWCYSGLEEVKSTMKNVNYPEDKILYVKGKVEDTLPTDEISSIAILRLDTDWYESTKHELEHLFDKLVPGGVLIIDDYGHWSGAKKAVDEFLSKRGISLFLNRIDYTGRLAIKP